MPINRKERLRDARGKFTSPEDVAKVEEDRKAREEKRDKATTKAADTLHQDFSTLAKSISKDVGTLGDRGQKLASVNTKLVKDNAKFFNAKAEKFLDQSNELEARNI